LLSSDIWQEIQQRIAGMRSLRGTASCSSNRSSGGAQSLAR
jgi:hypothetical protein